MKPQAQTHPQILKGFASKDNIKDMHSEFKKCINQLRYTKPEIYLEYYPNFENGFKISHTRLYRGLCCICLPCEWL